MMTIVVYLVLAVPVVWMLAFIASRSGGDLAFFLGVVSVFICLLICVMAREVVA